MALDLSGFTELQPVGLVLANQDPANLQFANNPEPPSPQTLTWVGGGDNSVDDPGDWTPNAVPEAGDKLYMLDGITNIPGGNLAGDVLNVGYNAQGANPETSVNPTINVTGGADVTIDVASPYGDANNTTINIADSDTLAMGGGIVPSTTGPFEPGGNTLAINIANGATLTASGGMPYGQTTIAGDGNYDPTSAYFAEGSLKIQSDMIGTGTVNMGMLQADISGSVAAGVSINLQVADTLTIDNPSTFLGTIIGPAPSASDQYNGGLPDEQVNLQGLVADSYDLSNDLLTLYKSGAVVDTVKFNQDANSLFVGQGASGVVIGMNETIPAGATALTQHIAISM